MDLFHVLDIAIEREKGTHDFYSQAAKITKDSKGKEAFVWLAHQEIGHFNSLCRLKEALLESGGDVKLAHLSPEDEKVIASMPASEASGAVTPSTTASEALQGAIENERASIELYRRLERSITDRAIKAMLDGLVAEEQSHLLILEIQSKAWEQSQTFVPLKELPTELLG